MQPGTLVGTKIGRYHLQSLIGTGGVAAVYQASDALTGRRLAVKVLFPPPGAGPTLNERFRREARTAANLEHPGIIQIFDVGEVDGQLFIAMQLVEGTSLQKLLETQERLDETTAAEIVAQVAEALDYAHRRGVIHRDVKPSNILIDSQGRALLTDFGVARALDDPSLTATGLTVGTPNYMSPEQARGRGDLDGRSDLYSLGVVLYQSVTGRIPFRGSTPEVMHAHAYDPPPRPSSLADVSPGMEAIVLKALAKRPDNRYPSGAALAADLKEVVDPTLTRQLTTPSPVGRRWARNWLGWGLAGLLALVVIGGGVGVWLSRSLPTPAPSPTVQAQAVVPPDTPRPTLPSPSLTATPADVVSPTRSLSATPTNTYTPLPPTSTPQPTPSPTPTPASRPPVKPPPCPQPVAAEFTNWLSSNADLPGLIGCPRGQAFQSDGAWQPFEQGQMLWRSDLHQITVLRQTGTWAVYDDAWREGDPEWDPDITPPNGLYQPVRGFGSIWRDQPGVSEALGWATANEAGFDATFQPFDRGLLVADVSEGQLWALLSDGTWLAGP